MTPIQATIVQISESFFDFQEIILTLCGGEEFSFSRSAGLRDCNGYVLHGFPVESVAEVRVIFCEI